MSTTILTRTGQGPVSPLARVQRRVSATPKHTPGRTPERRPSRKDRREARRARRYDGAATILNPRVIDAQIRSAALWPRSYR